MDLAKEKVWLLVIDSLRQDSVKLLTASLQRLTSLLACQANGLPKLRIGVCVVTKGAENDVQLQILLRPKPLNLSNLHHVVAKLPAGHDSAAQKDAQKTVRALQSLVGHISSDAELAALPQTITLVGDSFGSAADFKPLLQAAAVKCIQVDFVAFPPEESASDEASRAMFAAEIGEHENASTVCLPCDPYSMQQATMRWLQALLPAQSITVQLQFPQPLAATTSILTCHAVSEVLPLQPTAEMCAVCPCHGAPVQLQLHGLANRQSAGPTIGMCSVTSAAVRLSDCRPDASHIRIGPDVMLHLPPACSALCAEVTSQPAGGSAAFSVRKRVKVSDLSEAIIFGRPHVLLAADDECEALGDEEDNGRLLAAVCQVLCEQEEVLLASSRKDLDTGQHCAFDVFYILCPAHGSGVLLAKRIASSEELLPLSQPLGPQPEVSAAQLEAVKRGLGAVPAGDFSPLDHTNGAPAKLDELLRHSLANQPQTAAAAQNPGRQGGSRTRQSQPRPGVLDNHPMLPGKPLPKTAPAPHPPPDGPQQAGQQGGQAAAKMKDKAKMSLPPAPTRATDSHSHQPAPAPGQSRGGRSGQGAGPPGQARANGQAPVQSSQPFAVATAAGPSRLQFKRIRKAH